MSNKKRKLSAGGGAALSQQDKKARKPRKKSGAQKFTLLVGEKWPDIVRVGVTLVDIAMRIRDRIGGG